MTLASGPGISSSVEWMGPGPLWPPVTWEVRYLSVLVTGFGSAELGSNPDSAGFVAVRSGVI